MFLSRALLAPFCSEERTICAILVKGITRNNCEIILNFDELFRRYRLKDLLSRALVALMTIYAILVEGIMGNIHVKSSLI